jgi:regulator of sigma E protease
VKDYNDVGPIVNASGGRTFEIVVEREGKERRFPIAAKKDGDRYRIGVGIMPRPVFVKGPIGEAIKEGVAYPYEATRLTVHNFAQIFAGKQKAEFSGPIGIVRVLKSEIARSAKDGLAMVAMISSLLGFFNLLPFPGLDGGRLIFLAYEATRRKPVNARVEQTVHLVGILSLFAFLLIVSWKDVVKLLHH